MTQEKTIPSRCSSCRGLMVDDIRSVNEWHVMWMILSVTAVISLINERDG
jgi:hypothetical protein